MENKTFLSRIGWDTSQLLRKSLTSLKALTLLLVMCLSIGNAWGGVKYDAVTWSNIANGDTIIIVGAKTVNSTTTNYVMVQATPPTPTAVTITSNAITNYTANTEFVAEVENSTIKFRVAGSATNYLVGTNTNNGLKIAASGSNSNIFSIDESASGGPRITFTYTKQRWCGIYNTQDWRCYDSKDGTNIKDTKTLFFKKVHPALKSISVSSDHRTFTVGDAFVKETVTATYDDNSQKDVTADATFSGYDLSATGDQTVNVSYTENAVEKQTSYSITVNAASGSKVTVTANPAEGGEPSADPKNNIAQGTEVTLSANPKTGYTFTSWYAIDGEAEEITVTDNKFHMPATDVEVEATYTPIAVTEVQLNKSTTSIEEGASETLIATIVPSDALVQTLTWNSADPSIATVDQTGKVAAVKAGGPVNITATSNNSIVATCAVTVTPALPTITITKTSSGISTSYSNGTFTQNEVTFAYNQWLASTSLIQAKKETVGSLCNNTAIPGNIRSIEFVTGSGKTARAITVKAGLTSDASTMSEITAPEVSMNMVYDFGSTTKYKYFQMSTLDNACYFDKIIIKYQESTDPSIIVTPKPYHFEALDNATDSKKFGIAKAYLTGTMSAEIIEDADSKFSAAEIVNDSVVVTFKPAGGIGSFSAKLVVKSMKSEVVEASDTVALTGEGLNSNIPVTGVTVNKQELSLEKNATEKLTATVTPDNASVKTVTWSSDNTAVATVDANGLVTALKKGTANIIATSNNNINDTCALTVTLPATWTKVTEAKTDWTGEYLLVYEDNNTAYVWTGISDAECYVTTTITNNEITKPAGVVTLKIDSMTGGCSLQIKGGTNDNKYISGTSGSNALNYGDNALVNTLQYVSGDNSTILITSNTSVLRYNSSSKYFRYYKSSTYTGQKAIQLYELASTEPSVKLNKKATSLSVGAKETLTATVKNSEATVVWSTLDADTATVEDGQVTAVGVGKTKIIATITEAGVNYADTCVVTVTPAATVTGVTIAPQDTTLYIYGTTPTKQSATFTATVEGENDPAQTVTWKSLDDEVATVSEDGVVSAVAAGMVKIVAISTVDDTKSDTAEVAVITYGNTAETAYTTAEAIAWIEALGSDITKTISVYVKGKVSTNDGLSSSAITYWLDEDAFEVYKGKGIGGADFTSVDQIKVGDSVVVCGNLTKYVGDKTIYEFSSGSNLVSRKTAAVLTWSAGAYTAPLGAAEYDYPTLTKTPSNIEGVTYESSNTDAATINDETGEIALVAKGTTAIKAAFAGNDTLFAAEATYTLTVADAVQYYTITYNSNGGSEVAAVPGQTNLPSTFPTSTKDFKVFGGWYLDNDVFEVPAVADMPLTKDTTLYAKWDEPKSVTEMLALIPESGNEVDNVYGWGYIKAGASVSSGYAYYYITDGSDNDFYIYKGLNVNGESFTSADQLPSGNKVMIFGTIKNYKGTPEFDQGSRIINNAAVTTPVTGVSLNKEEAEVMIGKNVTLIATVAPSHATNQNVTWSSNKESIATVDATGKVTGVAAGDATITVTTEEGGFQASCAVTVVAAPTFDNGIWVKVTNTADLTADSYVIIAAKSYTKAIKTYVSGNNHGAQDVTVSGEILSYTTAPAIFQVKDYVKSEATVGKAFLNIESGNYLYLPDNNNKLTETASMEDKSAFTFAITDGVHSLKNYSISTRQMKYNNGSTCFACYTSGQDNIVVYKYMEGAFALSFDANGGQKTSVPGSMIVQGAVTIPEDVPTHATAGTKFAYYTPDKAGEGTHYVPGQKNCEFTQNTTLYAQWNVLTARHITYNAGGGTGSVPTDAANYYEGDSVTLKAATNLSNPGHIFSSWEVSYNDGEKHIIEVSDNNKFAMPDYDVTATAIWAAKTNDKWVLVTSEDQLVVGDKYVFAANGYGAVNGSLSGAFLTKVNATFSDNKAYITGMNNQLPLELGGSAGAWTFRKDESNYLANSGVSLSWNTTATTWTIEISDGTATIKAGETPLRYNNTDPRFKTYSSGQKAIQLYRMIPAVVVEGEKDASTLDDYANITVSEGGNLTLTSGTKNLGDVYVMAGGKVTIEESVTLTVQNFVIKSTMAGGQSGQVFGVTASNLVIEGDAYYDVTLDGNADPDKWHAVGVPFDVDAINGIYDMEDNKLVNETNYAVMVYQGDVRAQGKYGWIKIHKTNDKIMHPGVFYLFGVDGTKGTTYRFKMNGGFSVASKSIMTYEYPQTSGVATDAGWNGIGNNQLEYSSIDKKVQVLNISSYTFEAKTASSTNFTVGTPFFYQAEGTGYVTLVTGADKPAYAPTRMGNEAKDVEISLANDKYTDHLYISATDEATNEYQIGRDLKKMTMTSAPVVPQIFAQAYNTKLCMVDAPMVNNEATYALSLYAPQAGEYTLSAAQVEGYEVFLTKKGEIIWNLSMDAYDVELNQGNTEVYGIVLRKAPNTPTAVEGVRGNADGYQKFIYDERLIIIRNGQTYNAAGALVK